MREIVIRTQPVSDKCRGKALKVAAAAGGVQSVSVTGRGKDLLLVIGDGVDEGRLIKKLKKELGDAEIVELQTLPDGASTDIVFTQSPYQWRPHSTPGQSMLGAGHIEFPVTGGSGAGYYPRTTLGPWHLQHPSPTAGQPGHGGGYSGSSSPYARAVARSHPANYSPMIARHDYGSAYFPTG